MFGHKTYSNIVKWVEEAISKECKNCIVFVAIHLVNTIDSMAIKEHNNKPIFILDVKNGLQNCIIVHCFKIE